MCERELETKQNCNILTPTPMAITAFLSGSPGLLNRGPGGPASQGHVPHSSIFSLTCLISNSIRGLRAPSAGCWLSLPHLASNWSGLQTNWLPVFIESYNSSMPTFFLWASQITLIPPSMVKATLCYSSTGCTCYLHRYISYFDSPAGSKVNI